MSHPAARRLLDQIGILRHPCDLDLLLFFLRHRHVLLSSEHLASFVGYELTRIAESLDILLAAGLVRSKENPVHAARLYVLSSAGTNSGSLSSLLQLASTRDGRLALLEALPPLGDYDPIAPAR